jgi:2,4-dienoyl-CoA reductase-like NADH-dependent reductase (Old Yellow Enzyme family)
MITTTDNSNEVAVNAAAALADIETVRAEVAPLFEPLQIRGLHVANRIVMSPMTREFSPSGIPGPEVVAYYRRRAEAETGLLITEGVGIDHPAALGDAGLGEADIPHLYGDEALAGWRSVVNAVHAAGGRIIPQLWHQGVMREQGTGPHPEVPSVRPSGLWGPMGRQSSVAPDYVVRVSAPTEPMTEEDIADVISAYGRSAARARDAGFDGIAIHGAHGYLIDTFFWPETNQRTDRWGGSIANRARFGAEVVRAIRAAVGPDLPIFFRFSQWKQQDFRARLATTPQELEQLLGPLADAGVDVFDGSVRYFNRAEFEGSPLNLSGWAKKVTGKLAMAVGGIGLDRGMYDSNRTGKAAATDNITLLMERFNRGEFDLVAVGRSLLNDPEWTRKLRRGEAQLPFDQSKLDTLY